MLLGILKRMGEIYRNMDSVLITDENGIIEYCAIFDEKYGTVENGGYTGMSLLDAYPGLTEETSSHFRVIKYNKPIIDEIQELVDYTGHVEKFISSTYPIEYNGRVIGAVEGTIKLSKSGKPNSKRLQDYNGGKYFTVKDIIGESEQIEGVKDMILRTANGEASVLIVGDTGTGKELVAQALHSHSKRKSGPFISQNCSAIPSGLLESILFGTVKGSYTDAQNKKGLFELADKGTLFLDEMNSMSPELQGKIVKVVEEQKLRRLGDEEEREIDVRILSAVNENPERLLNEKRLRKDLYYRLGVVQIKLPTLKERREDIPLLTKSFIEYFNTQYDNRIKCCSDLAMNAFMKHSWPGNIRELRNAVEYAFNIGTENEIRVSNLPEHFLYSGINKDESLIGFDYDALLKEGVSLMDIVNRFEKMLVEKELAREKNMASAARRLNVSRQVIRYKMKKHGL